MEMKLKKVSWPECRLSGAEFFRTSLKGIDLSGCAIDGLVVSENLSELKGAKISPEQGMDVARIAGLEIIF